ncbi:MAG: LON peptidase substrate-binding domain-containing protein, partial [Planctomycetota bacterium]
MGRNLKNFLFPDGNWPLELGAEDAANLEIYLQNENPQAHENANQLKMPDVIGILPIRNAVAYPGTIMPLAIGRQRSKALLDDTKPNETIIGLVTQHSPQINRPN